MSSYLKKALSVIALTLLLALSTVPAIAGDALPGADPGNPLEF